jgi:hypothetical protein
MNNCRNYLLRIYFEVYIVDKDTRALFTILRDVISVQYMEDLLSMGPPVYFVLTEGLNYSQREVQNVICGGQGCNADSLYTQIYSAAKQSSVSVSLDLPCTSTSNMNFICFLHFSV